MTKIVPKDVDLEYSEMFCILTDEKHSISHIKLSPFTDFGVLYVDKPQETTISSPPECPIFGLQ